MTSDNDNMSEQVMTAIAIHDEIVEHLLRELNSRTNRASESLMIMQSSLVGVMLLLVRRFDIHPDVALKVMGEVMKDSMERFLSIQAALGQDVGTSSKQPSGDGNVH